jgi:hypothetical protein
MGFLRKRGPKAAEITQYTGLQIQTSSDAVPIAIVYGNNKVAPNLLWYGDFLAVPEYSKGGSGGKGGGRQTVSGYHYYTGMILGLCEGAIASVSSVTKDQGQYSAAALNFSLVQGYGSAPTLAYQQDVTYKGIAYVVSASYDLGSSATIGSLQFELSGLLQGTAAVNARDADPAYLIYDFLTSEQYGVRFPAGSIDGNIFAINGGPSSYQTYCWAARIAMSPVLANRESANSILARWLHLTNSAAVWSEGSLKVIPYADADIYGYLYDQTPITFTPNVTPIYDLTDEDFVSDNPDDDPVLVERNDPFSTFNVQEIEISDRAKNYNSATITVWDQNSIELYGRREASTVTAHEICDKSVAQTVAQLMLQRNLYIRNTYTFKLSFEYCLLEPMDIVTLTDVRLGLQKTAVRIVSIEEDDNGVLDVTAEELPGSTGTAAAYKVQANEAKIIDRNIVPSAVNPPVIYEPPSSLTGGKRQVWMAISGGLASVRRLEEDGSTGTHLASATFPPRDDQPMVSFSAYVKPGERSACRLGIFDGTAVQGVSFDLTAAGVPSGATSGIAEYSITAVDGGWYSVLISCRMNVASAAPLVSIALENPVGTASYGGTPGDGLSVWNLQFGIAGGALSNISVPMTVSGGSCDPDAQDPPIGAEGTADPYWGGCIVHVSIDDATYGQIGQINGPARHGKVTSDAGAVLGVDLIESGGTLESASTGDAQNGVTLSLAGDELLAYGGAILTTPNAYNLSNLARGLYGTANMAHSADERFARLDDAIFKYDLPTAFVGQMLYLKFQSFNIFGQGLQDLSTCATYAYTPTGAGEAIGPMLEQLALGGDVDLGYISTLVTVEEDLSVLAAAPGTTIDLGVLA